MGVLISPSLHLQSSSSQHNSFCHTWHKTDPSSWLTAVLHVCSLTVHTRTAKGALHRTALPATSCNPLLNVIKTSESELDIQ